MTYVELFGRRTRVYAGVAALLALWLGFLVYVAVVFEPDLYWFSYYSLDYSSGFIRRGLAGELLRLFPTDSYFTGLRTLRWLEPSIYIAGLLVVARTVAIRYGRSERRLMLALFIPVLPFGFAFAVLSAHPDLYGGAALAVFATVLASTQKDRAILLASAAYGLTSAVVTLAHEAVPAIFSLGAIIAIVVLAQHSSINVQRFSAILAFAPGLGVVGAVTVFGRHGISSELCSQVPHGAVDWPAAGKLSVGQILEGKHFYIDYHDWMCHYIVSNIDSSFGDAWRLVSSINPAALIASTVFGVAVCAVTFWAIGRISGVPFRRFSGELRGRLLWVLLAALLILPIFVVAVDWVRWWVTISFDVGVVYLLYASGQPAAAEQPPRRSRLSFAVMLIIFALIPVGAIPSFGVPPPA